METHRLHYWGFRTCIRSGTPVKVGDAYFPTNSIREQGENPSLAIIAIYLVIMNFVVCDMLSDEPAQFLELTTKPLDCPPPFTFDPFHSLSQSAAVLA